MADWTDISDLWWLQPQRESGRALQGLALGAQMRQARTQEDWRAEQAQVLMDQRRAAMQTQEAKVRGIAAMSSYMADVAARNAWTDPAAKAGFYRLGAQYPQAIDDPTLQAMARNFEMAEAREAQARQHAQTTTITEISEAHALERIIRQAEQAGPLDEEASFLASQWREKAAMLKGKHVPTGETIEMMDPNTGRVITRIARGGAGKAPVEPGELTVAARTKLQENLMSYADVAETLAYIDKFKDSSDFGVHGKFKELYARVAGQLGIPVPPGTVSVRTAVGTMQAGLIKALKSDGNIAKDEVARLLKLVPSADDITESYPVALDKMREVTRQIWGKSRRAAEQLKLPRIKTPWLLTPEQIKEEFEKGSYGDPKSKEVQERAAEDLRTYHPGYN